jgi:hypothetical protein
LDSVVEELLAVKKFEVFWDQSRTGYPRIFAEKCSNRHGNFMTIEEFDGRKRYGSIMILEGRYGQGWERLKSEVSKANSSLSVWEKWKCKKVMLGRSYIEIVMETQAGGFEVHTLKSRYGPTRLVNGPKTESQKEKQMPMVGEGNFTAIGEGKNVSAPVCSGPLSASIPKTVPYPINPSVEALRGRFKSTGDGSASLGQLGL